MRSKELPLPSYETDKAANGYLDWYDSQLARFADREVKLLELGIARGGSLLLWRDYFPKGLIVGVDVKIPAALVGAERIQMFRGSQGHESFLRHVADTTAPDGFDVIIDDASHIGRLSKRTFTLLFDRHLKPGGLYVIEDWGTGYWADWPDGSAFKSQEPSRSRWRKFLARGKPNREAVLSNHNYGMVGFIKELIDEQGAADLTRARSDGEPQRESRFEQMLILPSIVFITKKLEAR